mmetsp:Transcript_16667/g.54460  ORF Transcript_16667/g.54460 Transcript_16667/m.54460 type:complete len:400 (-) Transcript_16667:469-1668(-)
MASHCARTGADGCVGVRGTPHAQGRRAQRFAKSAITRETRDHEIWGDLVIGVGPLYIDHIDRRKIVFPVTFIYYNNNNNSLLSPVSVTAVGVRRRIEALARETKVCQELFGVRIAPREDALPRETSEQGRERSLALRERRHRRHPPLLKPGDGSEDAASVGARREPPPPNDQPSLLLVLLSQVEAYARDRGDRTHRVELSPEPVQLRFPRELRRARGQGFGAARAVVDAPLFLRLRLLRGLVRALRGRRRDGARLHPELEPRRPLLLFPLEERRASVPAPEPGEVVERAAAAAATTTTRSVVPLTKDGERDGARVVAAPERAHRFALAERAPEPREPPPLERRSGLEPVRREHHLLRVYEEGRRHEPRRRGEAQAERGAVPAVGPVHQRRVRAHDSSCP